MEIDKRTKDGGRGCYQCSMFVVREDNCFANKYPDLLKDWDFEKNKEIDPFKIFSTYDGEVYWTCDNNHSYLNKVINRVNSKKSKCLVCSSFGYRFPDLLMYWDYEKNKHVDPYLIPPYSDEIAYFRCPVHYDITFYKTMSDFTNYYKTSCSKCKAANLAEIKREKGEYVPISDSLKRQWNYEKNINFFPENVTHKMGISVHWKCDKCSNRWESTVESRQIFFVKNLKEGREFIGGCRNCGYIFKQLY